ncbi:MAG: class I SAM-dependent methyltransferase [Spirochaetales bacterium]|nr:class I SAM-dependent methyltransferase [Spirochaetales bacterium]
MLEKWYSEDNIAAVHAKFNAQKIAFAPLTFQAARSLRDLGVLELLSGAKDEGLTREQITDSLDLSDYAVGVLLEIGLSMDMLKIKPHIRPWRYILGKTGYFLLHDPLTRVNMDFMHDVCYKGGFYTEQALKQGKPAGLKVFGDWQTIYEGLSSLPQEVQKSWFGFDHFYSDRAFSEALEFVFARPRRHLVDIGGNTAKWALTCYNYNSDVKITIVDLPGQADLARQNITRAGAAERIFIHEANVLDPEAELPENADAVWMSQFLDCFSLDQVTQILSKVAEAVAINCDIFIMEPFWDKQHYPAATYSLHATSLYFTTMANGNSKMYKSHELIRAITRAGFALQGEIHDVGPHDYSILRFRKT